MTEVIEQKPIGIPIGIDGSFSNTEFKDGVLQIKESSLDPLEYYPMGLWTSKITDIGDNFKEYGKIIVTSTNKNGSRVEISTRSSADGISFSIWQRTTEDGSILSPKNKFIQVRLALYAGATISNIDIANDEYTENNEFVENAVYQEGSYITPTLTSKTSSPLGFSFSSSSINASYDSWHAFDKNNATYYCSVAGEKNGFLGFYFNKENKISKYKLTSSSGSAQISYMPKSWILQGSNDTTDGINGTWDDLDTRTNQIWSAVNTTKEFEFLTKKQYHAYRVKWSENNGNVSYTGMGELDFYESGITSLSLKRAYDFDMILDSTWSDTGSLHRKPVTRNEWLKIDKLKVVKK